MDSLVKEMLKLIEEEGDSFAKKAEMYYRRRPQLISHVEDFYRMYRALAERYDNVTGELRKNMPSDLQSQSSGNGSDFGVEPASPSFSPSHDQTPERKKNHTKPFGRAAGFDVFLRSGGSSDFSRKGSDDDDSLPSESSSDSEDGKVVDADVTTSGLNTRIIQLEEELREVREKLKEYEKGFNGQCDHFVSMEENQDQENNKMIVLEGEIRGLKEAMEAAAKKFKDEIWLKKHTIEEYKTQVDEALDMLMKEKSTLEVELNGSISDLKLEAKQLSEKKSILEIKILKQEQRIGELKASAESSGRLLHDNSMKEFKACSFMDSENIHETKIQALEDRVRKLEVEKCESCSECPKLKAELKRSMNDYELKVDMLTSEKDELNARVSMLLDSENIHEANLQVSENRVRELEDKKIEACSASAKLIAELNRSLDEYKLKVDMLISEKDEVNARVSKLSDLKSMHESKIQALENLLMKSESAKNEACSESMKHIEEINLSLDRYKLKVDMLTSEKDELNFRVSTLIDLKNIHEAKFQALEDRLMESENAKAEACSESAKHLDELNQSLDRYKLKVDLLASDKDELNAWVGKLMDDAKCRDDNSHSMAEHLHQLHIEHVNLIKEVEEAKKYSMELMNSVRELEGEVERQRVLILDGAEAKREAIRQLCFSLEHYRDGYQKLRKMLQGHNRRVAIMAT